MTDNAEGGSGTTKRPPWATGTGFGSLGTTTFKPPPSPPVNKPIAPAPSSPVEPRHPKSLSPAKSGPKKPIKVSLVFLSALVVILVVAAGFLTWKAFSVSAAGTESVAAPLPAQEFEKPVGGEPRGPSGQEAVTVGNAAETTTMTAADMAANTLFIPALGVYMPVEADEAFESSQYAGFDTIRIPDDATHGVWYAGGAPMYGGNQGVTMIASHVSTATGWGALRYLYTLTGGEMIYTKDADGQLQSWQMSQMRVEEHTEFPQEYWSAEGERRLVITTCGGPVNANYLFSQNVFAVALPVAPKPVAEQPAAEAPVEEAPADEAPAEETTL